MVLLGTTYEMLAEVDIQSLVRKLAMKLRAIVHGLQALLVAAPAAALEFQHCLPTSLPPARLWSYLAAALRGEDTQGLWPRRYSTIRGELVEGGELEEVVFGATTIRYRISNLRPGRGFSYAPVEGQPLRGRSSIEIEDAARGSVLNWQGRYDIAPWSPRRLPFRLYEALFFDSLRRRLKALETADESTGR
jgi:hypothetical protein